ncbi:hypothetical protein D9613_006650 [Agrocybe pediades]|uniref:Polysaccharide lyase 14 domain-containing protein n=1 Tax=Agrocybe pediades TaxID=84607 RepID=A0A8H4QGW2_9AGAR|nr:hypothetical protein D9613_006650 [Agrocybe pediades]
MFSKVVVAFFLALLAISAESRPVRRGGSCRARSSSAIPTATKLGVVVATSQIEVAHPSSSVVSSSTAAPVKASSSASSAAAAVKISSVASAAPTTTSKAAVKTTKASSVAQAAPTSAAKGLLGNLFPVNSFSKSWTTSPSSNQALALSDAAFRPQNVLRTVPHTYTKAPDGKDAMKAHYPQGSYTFGNYPQGGFSFYAPGPSNVDLTTAKEATFGYSVFFPEGFAFNLGGKLPGLYGGNSEEQAIGCSGGSRSTACFSARLMWRENGAGEFYTYLPPYTIPAFSANNKVCNVAPKSDCNPEYGASVGRGAFKFATGAWTTISERVKLNDVGQANGELELFVNGQSVINVGGLILRDSAAGRIRGMQMQTFFGGSKPQFKSPKDQDLFFSDFSVAITKTL